MKKLNIALFCSMGDTIPPKKNIVNAPRWLVYYLANLLSDKGHKVSLFAVPGSKTKANLVSDKLTDWPKNNYAKKLDQMGKPSERVRRFVVNDQTHMLKVYTQKNGFDILHAHTELVLPLAALKPNLPVLITYHSPYDPHYSELFAYYQKKFSHLYFNSLSRAHAAQAPNVNFDFTVNNGIDTGMFKFNIKSDGAMLFSGRITPDKGADVAVAVARKTKKPLDLVGQKFYASPSDKKLWDTGIQPFLNNSIQYRGFVTYKKMKSYYQRAKLLLFPDRWKEAFGMVMIESMACGAPVVAFNRGAVPEVVKDGITGYIVKNEKQMIAAVKKIYAMPEDEYIQMRRACREHVEKNFSIERMVDNYEKLYYTILQQHKKNNSA